MDNKYITGIEDAIKRIKAELNEELTERKFSHYLGSSNLRVSNETGRIDRHHSIYGCNFYKNGEHYGTLVIDFDPDWNELNSASYYGHHQSFISNSKMQMDINKIGQRTNEIPKLNFGRSDSHQITFLGINPDAEKVNSGLSADFMPRFEK